MKPGEMNERLGHRPSYSKSEKQPAWKKKEFQKAVESDSSKSEKDKIDDNFHNGKDQRDRKREERKKPATSSSSSGIYKQ